MRRHRGLTLGEVMVALAVASVAILTLTMLLGVVHRAQVDGKVEAVASSLARKLIERLRGDSTFFTRAVGTQPYQVDETWIVDPQLPPRAFSAQIFMAPLSGSSRFYDVKVKVSWDQDQFTKHLDLETYLSSP